MNLLNRAHQTYQNFILDKVPHPLKHLKFLLLLLVILAVPLTVILSQNVQDLRQRASELTINAVQDSLTGEYFDLEIKNAVTRYTPGPEGGALGVNAVFSASGNRVTSISTLTGFVNFADGYPEQKIAFTRNDQGIFKSDPVKILTYGCVDLYSTPDKNPGFYVGTFCFGRPLLVDSSLKPGTRVYSNNSSAGIFIEAFNSGDQPNYIGKGADILINSMAFNKNSTYYRQYGAFGKIYYVGTNTNNLTEFRNLYYTFEIPHANNDLKPCGDIQRSFRNSKSLSDYINGFNTSISSVTNGPGGCGATYTSTNNLVSGFVGIFYGDIFQLDMITPTAPPYLPTPYPTKVPYPTSTPSAKINPPCQQYGDANLDGYITDSDVELIQKFIVNLEIPNSSQKKSSDVNNDGQLTINDVLLIRSYLNVTIPTFPVCSALPSPTPTPEHQTPMSLKTGYVTLTANDFTLNIGGKIYKAPTKYTRLSSDPGGNLGKYTTLEAEWIAENGAEMRMNMYFAYDGTFWYLSELRTYNGNSPADWLYYKPVDQFGQKVQHVLGQTAITHEITFKSPTSSLKFTNLALRAFTNSSVPTPTPTYGMSPTPTMRPSSTPTPTAFRCDFNRDGYLDILDYNTWLKQFINGGKPSNPSADCDGNGMVDIFDYNLWLREFRGFKK